MIITVLYILAMILHALFYCFTCFFVKYVAALVAAAKKTISRPRFLIDYPSSEFPFRYDMASDKWEKVYHTGYPSAGACGVIVDNREFWIIGGRK